MTDAVGNVIIGILRAPSVLTTNIQDRPTFGITFPGITRLSCFHCCILSFQTFWHFLIDMINNVSSPTRKQHHDNSRLVIIE